MAILYRSTNGHLKGKLGDTVIQRRFGKDVVSLRPEHYVTKSEKLKAVRKEFGVKVMFARGINCSVRLMDCWRYSKYKSISGYHKALSYNAKYISRDVPTIRNSITPPYEYCQHQDMIYIENFKHSFEPDSITFSFKSLMRRFKVVEPPYYGVAALYVLFADGKADKMSSLYFEEPIDNENKNADGTFSLRIPFEDTDLELIKKYRLLRGYFAIIIPYDAHPKHTEYTASHFFEENLNEFYKNK